MILDAVQSLFSALSFDGTNPRDPEIAKILKLGMDNTAKVAVTHEKVMAMPAIKRAVQIISDKIYGLPWYVFEENPQGRTWYRTHPAWMCVRRDANEDLLANAVFKQLTIWAMIWGNGCAWIDRSNSSRYRLYPLMPDRTTLVAMSTALAEKAGVPEEAGRLYIRTMIGGERKYFPYKDVIHIKGYGDNPYWGVDIVEFLSETFGGVLAREEFANRFFSNGANPVGFITMDGSLDEEDEETYMQSLSKAMSGLGKAHKVILLEEGAKFQQVTIDPIKSQMLEGKQFDVRQLANAIGINVHKLIDGASTAYAASEQANHEHKEDDVMPWVNQLRSEMSRKLLREEEYAMETHSIDTDEEQLEWTPTKEKIESVVEAYNNGLVTKDEARRKINFDPSNSSRADQFRIMANIIYEDDQALVSSGNSNANAQDLKATESYADVAEWSIKKIETRFLAIARDKAKNPKEFLAWLDASKPEQGPQSIQARINDLHAAQVKRLNELSNTCLTAEELANAI